MTYRWIEEGLGRVDGDRDSEEPGPVRNDARLSAGGVELSCAWSLYEGCSNLVPQARVRARDERDDKPTSDPIVAQACPRKSSSLRRSGLGDSTSQPRAPARATGEVGRGGAKESLSFGAPLKFDSKHLRPDPEHCPS